MLNIEGDRFLKGTIEKAGYLKYQLKDDNDKQCSRMAHILVAQYFVNNPNPEVLLYINHIDEDKTNPCADNLEWVTQKENCNHGTRNDRIKEQLSKPVNEYDLEGKYIRTWKSSQYVTKVYPVSSRLIQNAAKIENNNSCDCQTAYGRQWRYLEDDNIGNIEQIKSERIRRYNKNVDYDSFKIPDEYIYEIKELNEKDKCLNIITDIIQDKAFSTYYLFKMKEIENYITNQ